MVTIRNGIKKFLLAFALIFMPVVSGLALPFETPGHVKFNADIASAKSQMLGDPVRAIQFARDAEIAAYSWSAGEERDLGIATAQWLQGEAKFRANDNSAASSLVTAALATVSRRAPGSKLNADVLLSQAQIVVERGDPQHGLDYLQTAYRMFARLGDKRSEAKVLQSIGSIYQDAQDFERALYYYRSANEIDASDPLLRLSASNNMADAYAELGELDAAELQFKQGLLIAQGLKSRVLIAQFYSNIANLQTDKNEFSAANTSLRIGISLASSPEAAVWLPVLLGIRARLELAEGNPENSVRDIERAFALPDNTLANQSNRSLHLTAYKAYKSTGDVKHALAQLEAFKKMDDREHRLAASSGAALNAARFDFINQNARIAALKAGQLQRDVVLARVKEQQSTVAFLALILVVAVATIVLFFYLRTLRRNTARMAVANEKLEQSNTELAEAIAVKAQFLATTSHEIRTPLNGILGMTQVMLADGAITGVQRERLSLLDSAGRSMRLLVDDILNFAKIDAGMVNIETAPVDLRKVMPELVDLWNCEAVEKLVELRLNFERIDDAVITDLSRLRQIVFNLLSNAVKFTLKGSVSVNVRPVISDGVELLAIDVNDTGIGIPESAFETVFEPFRQLDTSTTRRFGGTGLGLAISRQLARALGGDITISSVVGTGSTFQLRLPYARVPIVHIELEPVVVTLPDGARRITIVSPSPIYRSFLQTALRPYFPTCDTCDLTGLDARIELGTLDIVLLDAESLIAQRDELIALVTRLYASSHRLAIWTPTPIGSDIELWSGLSAVTVIFKPLMARELADRLKVLVAEIDEPEL